jgi:hypothetical protein
MITDLLVGWQAWYGEGCRLLDYKYITLEERHTKLYDEQQSLPECVA